MEMTGEQRIPLAQAEVWRALNDPEVLKACVPGCESIEKTSDEEFQVTVVAAVGPVKAKFKGKMKLADLNPPNSYDLVFEGQGGAAGFAKGTASVQLSPEGSATLLKYTSKAQIGGKLAQIGSRLIDATARKFADEFFANFNSKLAPQPAQAQETPTPAKSKALPGWVWAAVVVAVLAVIYYVVR